MIDAPKTEMAPRGKRCSRCLCCDAVIVFDGEALCAACDDGTHPAFAEQRVAPLQSVPPPQPSAAVIEAAAPTPEKEAIVSYHKLTPEQIEAIRTAPDTESTAALSRRLGVLSQTVSYQRMVCKRKDARPQSHAAAPRIERAAATPAPPARSVAITLDVPEATLDAWWATLDLDCKAALAAADAAHPLVLEIAGFITRKGKEAR